jgi:hypothetical protein
MKYISKAQIKGKNIIFDLKVTNDGRDKYGKTKTDLRKQMIYIAKGIFDKNILARELSSYKSKEGKDDFVKSGSSYEVEGHKEVTLTFTVPLDDFDVNRGDFVEKAIKDFKSSIHKLSPEELWSYTGLEELTNGYEKNTLKVLGNTINVLGKRKDGFHNWEFYYRNEHTDKLDIAKEKAAKEYIKKSWKVKQFEGTGSAGIGATSYSISTFFIIK